MGWRDTIEEDVAPKVTSSWRDTVQDEPQESVVDSFDQSPPLRGVAQGATFGYSDELAGVGGAIADRVARSQVEPIGSPNPETDAKMRALEERETPSFMDAYRSSRDDERARNQKAQELDPTGYLGGEIGGGVLSPVSKLFPGPLKPKDPKKVLTTLEKLNSVKGLAAMGATQGLGLSESELTKDSDLMGASIDTGLGVLGSGLGYGVATGIGSGLKKATPVSNYILKKLGKITSNIPEEYVERYLRRKGNITARPETEIADEISGVYSDRLGGVKEATDLERKAQDRLMRAQEGYKSTERKTLDNLADEKFATARQADEANVGFTDAARATEEALRKRESGIQTQDVLDAINDLKTNVKVGSSEAYDILGNLKGSVKVSNVKRALKSGIESLKIKGQPISDTAEASINSLEKLGQRMESLGDNITFPEAKAIIQQLDSDIDYAISQGGFNSPADVVKKRIRSLLDQTLKTKSPEYKQAMEAVAEETRLLSDLSSSFGDEARVIGRLNQIGSPKGKAIDAPMLKALGEKTGRNFSGIDDVIAAKEVTGSPTTLKAVKESLPEFETSQALKKKSKELVDPSYRRKLLEDLKKTPEYLEMTAAEREVFDAIAAKESAKGKFESVKAFGAGIQSKMRALTGARNYETSKLFKELDRVTKGKYTKEIKDRALLDAFEKTDTQGSRKTLMGKAAGALIGGGIGAGTGGDEKGAATGAAIGFAMDRYSGRVLKALLDGKIAASEASKALSKAYGKYAPVMVQSALKGPKTLSITGAILSKDPEFKKAVKKAQEQ